MTVQTAIVALIVAGALAYAGFRGWSAFAAARAKKAGGGCDDCH
ncbi:MAG TPA: hypothetical protein VMT93_00010 [Gemmatimonadaceae bacterium]|nr:hypothetical protein [Gemmatimonadaceae bacterium]